MFYPVNIICLTTKRGLRDHSKTYMDIRSHIQRYEVLLYFALAFLISWGGSFAAVGPKFIRGEALRFTDALLVFLPMLIGPSLAGIVMAYLVDGKSGLQDLLSQMRLRRFDVRWYSTILIFPVLILAVQLGLARPYGRAVSGKP